MVAARDQRVAQRDVIVDFSVEDENDIAVVAWHGLLPMLQILDLQAYGA